MNAQQAKRIPLRHILEKLGCFPHHEKTGEIWYTSPFREESEPSFKIKEKDNVWYDFGAGEGGNVLDFIIVLRGLNPSDISGALGELSQIVGSSRPKADSKTIDLFAYQSKPPAPSAQDETKITIRKIQSLQNPALIQYLDKRGIPKAVAEPYVQEMYYTRNDKPYFALAFGNESNGYELRNPYFKGVQGAKDITLIPSREGHTEAVLIFEGFTDFLSYLAFYGRSEPNTAVLVLNSVAMKNKAVNVIKSMGTPALHLYLDHDEAGQNLKHHFETALDGVEVIDESPLYAGYKDFNDFLMNNQNRDRASSR